MAQQSAHSSNSTRDDLKRAAAVSLALTGGAVAALALAKYLSQHQGRTDLRVPLGGVNAASLESWLRATAEKLQSGSQSILSELEAKR